MGLCSQYQDAAMNFVVRSGFYLLVAVCILQVGKGFEIRIQREPDTIDVQGLNITLSCSVIGEIENVITIRWLLHGTEITKCNTTSVTGKVCNVTIRGTEETDVYTCIAYYNLGYKIFKETTINGPNPTVDLTDISTGDTVDVHSGAICVPHGGRRTFECTVRDASSGTWTINWVDDRDTTETGGPFESEHVAFSTGGMVNVSSKYTVMNPPDGRLMENLTCRALGPKAELLTVAVKLQSCTVPRSVVYVIVAVVSVLATLVSVLALLYVIKLRRAAQTSTASIQHADVSANEPPPQTALVSYDTNAARTPPYEDILSNTGPKYEQRITADAVHQYEGRITEDSGTANAENEGDLYSLAEKWQVSWLDLEVSDQILGRGAFGEVRLGAVKIDGETKMSAVKMLKGHASPTERDDFMAEMHLMTSIGSHPHIVSLIGACQHQDVLYVALEYLSNGDLRSYLRKARTQSDTIEGALSWQQLLTFALDIAKGMVYLSDKGVIHRDLAARNILLGDGLAAKVSDFGLSRGEDIYVQTSNKRVPVRWLAIESMAFQTYTTQSDVWSFGILLWEITTIGGTPYPSIKSEFLESKLSRGYRMPKPNNCDDKTYTLMRRCWKEDPKNRPTFDKLVSILSEMTDTRIKHTYMSTYQVRYENLSVIRPELDDN